jgi:hypothetical protein
MGKQSGKQKSANHPSTVVALLFLNDSCRTTAFSALDGFSPTNSVDPAGFAPAFVILIEPTAYWQARMQVVLSTRP